MCLLHLLPIVDRRLALGVRAAALHVDYGLRGGASDRDRELVEQACDVAGVTLHVERLEGSLRGRNFQARARDQRYGLARELAARFGYGPVTTAHNRDDQAETVLYRLVKYASPLGLAGMRPREDDLARPLLALGADEIRAYCEAKGIAYGVDASNLEPLYARNVLRLEVLPALGRLNPRVGETLADNAAIAAAEQEVVDAALGEAWRRVAATARLGDIAAVDLAALAAEPAALRALCLRRLAAAGSEGGAFVTRRHVAALEALAGRRHEDGRVALGGGRDAVRERGRLAIRERTAGHVCTPVELEMPEPLPPRPPEGAPDSGAGDIPAVRTVVTTRRLLPLAGGRQASVWRPPASGPLVVRACAGRALRRATPGSRLRRAAVRRRVAPSPSRGALHPLRPHRRDHPRALSRGGRLSFGRAPAGARPRGRRRLGGRRLRRSRRCATKQGCAGAERDPEYEVDTGRHTGGEVSGPIAEVLVGREELATRVDELAEEISLDYEGKELLLVGVLKGAVFFMADLARRLTVPCTLDFMAVSSYGSSTDSSGVVRILKDLDTEIVGRHVLIVEDIIDSGLTLSYLLKNLRTRKPASLEVCALLTKPARRRTHITCKYTGFEMPNKFVVGYGLDFAEHYRTLDYIAVLAPDAAAQIAGEESSLL